MTLRSRFLVTLGLFTAVALASGLAATWALSRLSSLQEASARSYRDQLVAVRLETTFLRCTQALSSVLAGHSTGRTEFAALLRQLRPGLDELLRPDASPATTEAVNSLAQSFAHLELASERALFMAKSEDTRSLQVFQGWLENEFTPQLARDTERVVHVLQAELARQESEVERAVSRFLTWILIGFVILVLLLLAALFGLRQSLLVPVESLVRATHEVARGEPPKSLPLDRADEIGRLATSIQSMARKLEESQQELVRKEQFAAVGQMTSTVAHNIRNPLASIRGLAQNLLLALPDDDANRAPLRTILETVDRMDRWLKGMLTSLRPIPLNAEPQDPEEITHSLERIARDLAGDRSVGIETRIDAPLPMVSVDRNRLDQALISILHNAIEVAPTDTTIRLGSRHDQAREQVEIVIEDEGPGIPDEVRERLFRPSFTTKPHGTGMGLYLAHRIILEHRGHIDVRSAPGQGTTMTVRLPVPRPESEF